VGLRGTNPAARWSWAVGAIMNQGRDLDSACLRFRISVRAGLGEKLVIESATCSGLPRISTGKPAGIVGGTERGFKGGKNRRVRAE
jgi:hypothetical protein